MRRQVQLAFDTCDEAIAYCKAHSIPYQVFEAASPDRAAEILCGEFPLRPQRALVALTGCAVFRQPLFCYLSCETAP